jgi:hypothetical protein
MNERIKELAEQAGIYKLNLSDETEYWIMEKFAELIVREAGEAFWSEACHVSDLAYEEYYRNSKKIKQHFGVTE